MALLPILQYPDPRLHTVAKPVAQVDDRIRQLVDDMLATMYDAKGVGLAATQINVHERVVVIDTSEERNDPLVLINPEITWASDEMIVCVQHELDHLSGKVFVEYLSPLKRNRIKTKLVKRQRDEQDA